MWVISPKRLRKFWSQHPAAEGPLRAWLKEAKKAEWGKFADVRETYGSADQVAEFVVFNVGGNKYRLIATIVYSKYQVLVRHVLTHAEYDRGKWKQE